MIRNEDIESRDIRVVRREEEDEENAKPTITPHVRKRSRTTVLRKQKYTMSENKKKKKNTSPKRSFKRLKTKSPRRSPKKTMKRSILSQASDDESESDTEPLDFEEPPAWLLGL